MPERFVYKPAFLIFVVALLACGTVRIYKEADKPLFFSNDVFNTDFTPADSLTVLSFNVEKAEKIQQAIVELQDFEKTRPVQIYLLQEMDEKGVQSIAEEFRLNYLY